jgi:hypothetical protein
MTPEKPAICFNCRFFYENYKCPAFRNGIPDEIILGENDHSTPLPNQGNDIVFEEKRTVVDINHRSNQN